MQRNQREKLYFFSELYQKLLITEENTITVSSAVDDILIINSAQLHYSAFIAVCSWGLQA